MRDPHTETLLIAVREAVTEARRAGVTEMACLWDAAVAAVDVGAHGIPSTEARRLADGIRRSLEPPETGIRVQSRNSRGDWAPAIPFPFYGRFRKRCRCGARFWTTDGYRGHYAYVHLIDGQPTDEDAG